MADLHNDLMIERIMQRQYHANEYILKEIGKIIGEINDLTPSQAYTISQQLKYGESLDNIVKILAKYSNLNENDIYKMLEAEAKRNLALKKVYFKAKNIDFIPYSENVALQTLVNEIALTTINTYKNISKTTGLTFLDNKGNKITKPLKEAYYQIIDDAIMNINMGKQGFNNAMYDQLQTLGEYGIQTIEYESGNHRRIDSAIRMNIQDGLNELAYRQQELLGKQFNSDGVEISTHENPSPDHADIQGHIFTNDEFNKMQNNLDFKDYLGKQYSGIDRVIGQWNCKHLVFSIIIGVSKPRYTQEELNEIMERNEKGFTYEGKHLTMYDGEQLMRRIELEMVKTKETSTIAKASGNNELYDKSQGKLDILARKYYKLSKVSTLPTRMDRIKTMVASTKQRK